MNDKSLDDLWEENISQQKELEALAEKYLQQEMNWLNQHKNHGKILIHHFSEFREEVRVKEDNWISLSDTSETIRWEFIFECHCGESYKVIDENTPEKLRII